MLGVARAVDAGATRPTAAERDARFPGLWACFESEFSNEIDERYAPLLGEPPLRLSAEDVAALEEAWRTDGPPLTARVSELTGSPSRRRYESLRHRRGQMGYEAFETRLDELHANFDHDPFLLLVQAADESRAAEIAGDLAPTLLELEEVFRAIAVPAGLKFRPEYHGYVLVVLKDRAEFEAAMIESRANPSGVRAAYFRTTDVGFTYLEKTEEEEENRHSAVHEMVHAMQDAYAVGKTFEQTGLRWEDRLPLMVGEGFADCLADRASSRSAEGVAEGALELYGYTDETPDHARLVLPPVKLARFLTYDQAAKAYRNEGRLHGLSMGGISELRVAYAHSRLLVHYLLDHHPAAARRYLGLLLKAEDPVRSFEAVFGDEEAEELDEGFLDFLEENLARALRIEKQMDRDESDELARDYVAAIRDTR